MGKVLLSLCAILWIGSFSLGFTWSGDTKVTVVQVQDRSASGNPFAVSGTVEIRETPLDNKRVKGEISEDILVRNISGRAILTFVAWLDVVPAYGAPEHSVRQYERFFTSELIDPGDELIFSEPYGYSISPYDFEKSSPESPRAELRIVYVQFLDGSLYGNVAHGRDIRRIRKLTWHYLKDLDKAYTKLGEADFLQELSEIVEPGENVLIENLRKMQRTRGTVAAVLHMRHMLQAAEEHQAGFTANRDD